MGRKLYHLSAKSQHIQQFNYYANRMRKVATDYKNELIFAVASKSDYNYELDDYDLSLPTRNDVGVGIRDGTSFYKMTDAFGIENLRNFISLQGWRNHTKDQ